MPNSEFKKDMIKWQLRQSMGEELTAASAYMARAVQALDERDVETAELYSHIANEEETHYKEFHKRLEQLGGGNLMPTSTMKNDYHGGRT